jgi:single-strand DNA-binding protein
MSNNLNSCSFIGRLGKDPEMRYQANGDAVASFSIAVGWKFKDKEGAEWVNISAFGKLASEVCAKYLKKGSKILVQGRLKTEQYTDKNGIEKFSTKIIASNIEMLDSKSDTNSGHKESFDLVKEIRSLDDDIPF